MPLKAKILRALAAGVARRRTAAKPAHSIWAEQAAEKVALQAEGNLSG